eukprot:GHVQ01041762.1.p1 GENE.GHVQ01041762.1~~GHVQ01041762.1.p1  ORF type:complete len:105 (+),score=2.52 GHVQ01041762.1:278-592(+)
MILMCPSPYCDVPHKIRPSPTTLQHTATLARLRSNGASLAKATCQGYMPRLHAKATCQGYLLANSVCLSCERTVCAYRYRVCMCVHIVRECVCILCVHVCTYRA